MRGAVSYTYIMLFNQNKRVWRFRARARRRIFLCVGEFIYKSSKRFRSAIYLTKYLQQEW